jgi:hypothetical protein
MHTYTDLIASKTGKRTAIVLVDGDSFYTVSHRTNVQDLLQYQNNSDTSESTFNRGWQEFFNTKPSSSSKLIWFITTPKLISRVSQVQNNINKLLREQIRTDLRVYMIPPAVNVAQFIQSKLKL